MPDESAGAALIDPIRAGIARGCMHVVAALLEKAIGETNRRREKQQLKRERTGDTPQKVAEGRRTPSDATVKDAVAIADLEHVTLTRDFLNDPGAFLRHL